MPTSPSPVPLLAWTRASGRRLSLLAASLSLLSCSPGPDCDDADDLPRSFEYHLPLGEQVRGTVVSELSCSDHLDLEIETRGATYTIQASERRIEVSTAGAIEITGTWNASGGVTLEASSGATIGAPVRPYLLVRAADIADFDPVALALLDWGALSTALALDGADPDGNDPAAGAERLPGEMSFLQDHPLVMRMEKSDLDEGTSTALVGAMDALMNDPSVVDYHHFGLCHAGTYFFTMHDDYVDDMEHHVRSVRPPLALPFGRLPWLEPGSEIPDAYATWSSVADAFYAELDACEPYPHRICTPELYYTVKFSSPQVVDTYPCDPADRQTWCEGLLLDLSCSDEIGTEPGDYLGCEDDDGDGLPDLCPYALLPRFQGDAICDYATVDDLWSEMIDWHGQLHERIGGAHGDHAVTATTPTFWLFHVTLGALYEGYIRCP